MKIAIIGTGNVGSALGRTLSGAGFSICFGVRPGNDVAELLATCPGATAASPAEAAAAAELTFLAVPGNVAVEAARALGDLSGRILVDCNNPMRWDGGPVWVPPPEGSLSAAIALALPGAKIIKGFSTFGAEFHARPQSIEGGVDVMLAGDDPTAKAAVAEVARQAGFRPIDAGPLRNAAVLENLAMLWIHLATVGGQGRQGMFKWVQAATPGQD